MDVETLYVEDVIANQAREIRRMQTVVDATRRGRSAYFAAGITLTVVVVGAAWLIGSYEAARCIDGALNAVGWFAVGTGARS